MPSTSFACSCWTECAGSCAWSNAPVACSALDAKGGFASPPLIFPLAAARAYTVLCVPQLVRRRAVCGACHRFLPELVCILPLAYVLRKPCRVAVLSTLICRGTLVALSPLPLQFPQCLQTTVRRHLCACPCDGADQSFDGMLVW